MFSINNKFIDFIHLNVIHFSIIIIFIAFLFLLFFDYISFLMLLSFRLQVGSDQCSVEKYALENEGTIQYEAALPKLEQFTLCSWMRFTNHKGDHSIFTYSGESFNTEAAFEVDGEADGRNLKFNFIASGFAATHAHSIA